MSTPKVAVQILSFFSEEGWRDLERALSSLLQRTDETKRIYELLVVMVDNPAPSGTAAERIKTEWGPKFDAAGLAWRLQANAVNNGFAGGHVDALALSKALGADYVLLLNQDAWVAPHAIENIVWFMEARRDVAVAQMLLKLPNGEPHTFGNALHLFGFGTTDAKNVLPHFYASGAAVMVRMSVLEEIGGLFNPFYFLYHEDVDLSWRARLSGYNVEVCPDAVAFHRYEFGRSVSKLFWMERNRWFCHLTHLRLATLLLVVPMLAAAELPLFALSLLNGWSGQRLRACASFLKPATWQEIVAERKKIAAVRRVGDREILRMMSPVIETDLAPFRLLRLANTVSRAVHRVLLVIIRW